MSTHREVRTLMVPRERLFQLVADVERYPEFLPLWTRARRIGGDDRSYETEQEIVLGPIRERFQSRTRLFPPDRIEITSQDPLFDVFLIRWRFSAVGTATRVIIDLHWRTRSRLLQRGIDLALPATARMMVSAFEKRAASGYPNGPLISDAR